MPPLESSLVALHPVQGSHPRSTTQTTPEPPNCSKPFRLLLYLGPNEGVKSTVRVKRSPATTMHGLTSAPQTAAAQPLHLFPKHHACLWGCGKFQKKKGKSDPPCFFLEFQKLQLNFTNSGGFWLVCVSQSPNFWLLNQALTQVVEVSLSLATISAFVFVLL